MDTYTTEPGSTYHAYETSDDRAPGSVKRACSRLSDNLDELEASWTRLIGLLEPILLPQQPESPPTEAAIVAPSESGLADAIGSHATRAQILTRRVMVATERLDL